MHEIGVLPLHGVVQHSATADVAGIAMPLDRLIAEAPDRILGPSASARFGGRLPYLFKVLDVASMLSIQVHPTKEQAAAGFARENAAGIDLGAAEQNYKDENHKPEMAVALTDFWMLQGFRPLDQIAEGLRKVPELRPIMPDFSVRLARAGDATQARRDLLRDLCCAVMTMPQERLDLLLNALVERLATRAPSDHDVPDYWAARAVEKFPAVGGHRRPRHLLDLSAEPGAPAAGAGHVPARGHTSRLSGGCDR